MTKRFVILAHDHPFLHWDLMLEQEGSLKTFRLLRHPDPHVWIPSEALPDHRLHYLTYEGPVSGDRGVVRRLFEGHYDRLTDDSDLELALQFTGTAPAPKALLRVGSSSEWEWRFE